jgi:hypothetical protein
MHHRCASVECHGSLNSQLMRFSHCHRWWHSDCHGLLADGLLVDGLLADSEDFGHVLDEAQRQVSKLWSQQDTACDVVNILLVQCIESGPVTNISVYARWPSTTRLLPSSLERQLREQDMNWADMRGLHSPVVLATDH